MKRDRDTIEKSIRYKRLLSCSAEELAYLKIKYQDAAGDYAGKFFAEQRKVKLLKDALNKYCGHLESCDLNPYCTCGLDIILESKEL